MTELLGLIIPTDLIPEIKLYTGEIRIRNGKHMRQLKSRDRRYEMLRKMPKIRQLHNAANGHERDRRGSVWFRTPDRTKHVVISVYYCSWYKKTIWEMNILGGSSVQKSI
jgi:hypothetical protein